MTKGRFTSRFVALVVVVALHCLFVLVLLIRVPIPRARPFGEPSVLFFIDEPKPTITTTPPMPSRSSQTTPIVIAEPNSVGEQPSIEPAPPDSPATIDWTAQATQAAAAVVDKAISEETRKCDPSEKPNSFLPPCKHRTKQFEWSPDPRFGFSGGLPYVRVGKRCAIGLGFFGCGFGEAPPANGDLFEGMDDPERDRSSVPSPNPPNVEND